MDEKVISVILLIAVATAILGNSIVTYPWENNGTINESAKPVDQLKRFNSPEEIRLFIEENTKNGYSGYFMEEMAAPMFRKQTSMALDAVGSSMPAPSAEDGALDFSTTNIQVEGVDEADIVKNDGKFVYLLAKNQVFIVDAYPPDDAEILSKIRVKGQAQEIYIAKDRLIVLGNDYRIYESPVERTEESSNSLVAEEVMPYPGHSASAFVSVYDISDRRNPRKLKEISVDGNYFDSRMIGDHVYVISTEHAWYYDDIISVPEITTKALGATGTIRPDVYYFDVPDNSYTFTTIASLNVQEEDEDVEGKIYLLGSAQNIYVSQDNIYVTYQKVSPVPYPMEKAIDALMEPLPSYMPRRFLEKTLIHKISIEKGSIWYKTTGEVPGRVLNQFSMDEFEGNLRLATTTGHVSARGDHVSANHIYVLDEDLEMIGSLEDLAPGERIYSARFMGKRAYLVTFKKVDPLFVIDLANPEHPEVLGKLKIPGYSDYLHPYDENHIIGLGKDTVEAERGDFALYQGIKIALFDVSEVERPREVSKIAIGDRGTDSYALHDHKAFLFSKEKNLLVIPILLAEIDPDRYAGELPKWAHGEFVWQGAYVLTVDSEKGIRLRGRISHQENDEVFLKSGGYYFGSEYSVKRSLYMDDSLYTISDGLIKINDLADLNEINEIYLS